MGEEVICVRCEKTIPPPAPGAITTGYGIDGCGHRVCYECCGKEDLAYLREHGKLDGYWTFDKEGKACFSNWPGSLKFPLHGVRKTGHNMRGVNQWFGYFLLESQEYLVKHVSGGFTQCARAKRTKGGRCYGNGSVDRRNRGGAR